VGRRERSWGDGEIVKDGFEEGGGRGWGWGGGRRIVETC